MEVWLKFLVAASIVVGAGLSLTRNAERLAAAMGWGHAFAGFVILGWATSLPEVTISLSAIGTVGSAALATGNITGSIIFNLAILALLDLLAERRRSSVDRKAAGVIPLGWFNVAMLAGGLLVAFDPSVLTGGLSRMTGYFLLVLYGLSTLHAWRNQGDDHESDDPDGTDRAAPRGERRTYGLRCLLAGLVILAAGTWLAQIGDELAAVHDLEEGLVGTIFLATVSSLPELVTGLAAVRLGLLTMAAGSILGSNIFNLGILGVCDLAYQVGENSGVPLIAAADDSRITANLGAGLAMTLLAMTTVRLRRAGVSGRRMAIIFWIMMLIYAWALLTH